MKVINNVFSFIITIQSVLFLFFLIENINNLDNIPFIFVFAGDTFSFTINIYSAFLFIATIFTVVLIAGINIFGGGLNSQGTKTMSKYMGLIAVLLVLGIGSSFYILALGQIGFFIDLIIILVYVLYSFSTLVEDQSQVLD